MRRHIYICPQTGSTSPTHFAALLTARTFRPNMKSAVRSFAFASQCTPIITSFATETLPKVGVGKKAKRERPTFRCTGIFEFAANYNIASLEVVHSWESLCWWAFMTNLGID